MNNTLTKTGTGTRKPVSKKSAVNIRWLVFTALMAAMSYVLAEFDFSLPIMPFFIKFDFSDAPAMLASFTMGPVSGVVVCLIKNAIGCATSKTACIGELSNFILGVSLVLPAGIIAHRKTKLSRAVIAGLVGAAVMGLMAFFANYFIIYPLYDASGMMSINAIIGVYQTILPGVDGLAQCLLIFNVPFTLVKGLCAALISILLYKRLRPVFNSVYRDK